MPDNPKSIEDRLKALEIAVYQQALMNQMLMVALSKNLHDHEALQALIEKINIQWLSSTDFDKRKPEYVEWLEGQAKNPG